MSAITYDNVKLVLQVAYQQYEAIEQKIQRDSPFSFSQVAYQQYEAKESSIYYPLVDIAKIVVNIVQWMFSGKAWLFDGSQFISFNNPSNTIQKAIHCDLSSGVCVIGGGLKPDGTIDSYVYICGIKMYIATIIKDGIAQIVGDGDIIVYDANGNVIAKLKNNGVVAVFKGSVIVSLTPFKVTVIEL